MSLLSPLHPADRPVEKAFVDTTDRPTVASPRQDDDGPPALAPERIRPARRPSRRPRFVLGGIALGAVIALAGLSLALPRSDVEGSVFVAGFMRQVADTCAVEPGPDGASITLEGQAASAGDDLLRAACVLAETGAPASVIDRLERAVVGVQEGNWTSAGRTFNASWTYGPDDGLSFVVAEVPSITHLRMPPWFRVPR